MPTPLKRCPTPDKEAYDTRGEAVAAFMTERWVVAHAAYRCCCGKWHITTKRFRKRGNIPDR